MLAILLSPLYVFVQVYIIRWLIRWLSVCRKEFRRFRTRLIVSAVYVFFASAMGVGFFLPSGPLKRFFVKIGNYWLGVLLYTILVVGAADLLHILLKRSKRINQEKLRSFQVFAASGILCAVGIAALSIWGMFNAGNIRTTKYEAVIEKDAEGIKQMKVVLAADLHMGYNIGVEQIRKMVDKINEQEPDLVVFAGDIFDNEYDALENPKELISILREIESKYGVYACYGNHDIKEKILAGFTFGGSGKKESDIRMDEFLKEAGITLLQDESVTIADSICLYGRPDRQRPGRGIKRRRTPKEITADMDLSKPIFVIDHQPKELQELADAGVDLDLCGHTHDGQMFPGNLTVRMMWENACGYLKKGNMHNIVTSGVGIFGPNMRVGTSSEICAVTVRFDP